MRVELVERARFDGVMTGVMRARGKLVDDNPLILGNEEFDSEDAGQFEALRQTQSEFVRFLRHVFADFGRSDGHVQNIVTMLVAHDREGHIILAVTGNENARFECKIDESFENARRESATAIGTGSYLFEIGIGFQHGLAVAVVPAERVFSTAG